jgi:glycerophosphoryl diester phosphodiesterase
VKLRARGRPEVHGHRGSPLKFPENTIPSFVAAIEAGADFIELDVQASRDSVLIVSHDPCLPGGERIHALDARDIHRHPSLEEVLDLSTRFSGFGFNIEIKSYPGHPSYGPAPAAMASLVWQAVRARGLQERVIVQSFDFRVLEAMRELGASAPLSALWEGSRRLLDAIASEAGTSCVSVQHTLVDETLVRQAHDAGVRVLVWTVNGERAWSRMLAARVDGIITDDPAGLVRFFGE